MTTRVLIVDDQPELRRLVRMTLGLDNYEVFEAESGQRSLEMVSVVLPQIVIMDAMMPGRFDGFQACEKIKYVRPDTKVIMLTSRAQKSDRELGEKVKADAYITKPFSPLALLDVLKNIYD
ncbi:response regulator transcription factor [Neptuniibacter sp. SY11_33]|uniref:response regulator transcription factor n=1 Tax=Neptuniibacter sp. SY11_33 TaxID=3398215 RepID=UPI0039F46E86